MGAEPHGYRKFSFDTGNDQRNTDVKSENFLDVANHPTMTCRSARVRQDGDKLYVDGELTIRNDYGISFDMALPTGGVMISEKIQLTIEVEATLETE